MPRGVKNAPEPAESPQEGLTRGQIWAQKMKAAKAAKAAQRQEAGNLGGETGTQTGNTGGGGSKSRSSGKGKRGQEAGNLGGAAGTTVAQGQTMAQNIPVGMAAHDYGEAWLNQMTYLHGMTIGSSNLIENSLAAATTGNFSLARSFELQARNFLTQIGEYLGTQRGR